MTKKDKWMFVLIILLIILNFNNIIKVQQIEQNIKLLKSDLQYDISNINNDVNSTLRRIRKNYEWIQYKNYKKENIDNKYEKTSITIDFDFNELKNTDKVYVVYDDNEGTSNKIPAEKIKDLSYQSKLILDYDKNYKINILVESNGTYKSENLFNINLRDELYNRFDIDIDSMRATRENSTGDLEIFNAYENDERLKLKSSTLYIYYKDKLIKTIDITNKKDHITNAEILSQDIIIENPDKENENWYEFLHYKLSLKDYLGKEYIIEKELW